METDFRAVTVPEHLGPTFTQSMLFSWSQAWPRAQVPCSCSAHLASLPDLCPAPALPWLGSTQGLALTWQASLEPSSSPRSSCGAPPHLCTEPLKLTPASATRGHALMPRVGMGVLIVFPGASTPPTPTLTPRIILHDSCCWIGSPRSLWNLELEKQCN